MTTIKDIEKSPDSSVWVYNTTDKNGQRMKGVLNLSVPDGMGNSVAINIPVTWIPIDLTAQATKAAILSAPAFRRLVQMGAVTLTTSELAEKIFESADAQMEAGRIYNIISSVEMDKATPPVEVKNMISEAAGNVSGVALNIAHNTTISEEDILSMLRSNLSSLTQDDLRYIVETSVQPRVKAFTAEHLKSS